MNNHGTFRRTRCRSHITSTWTTGWSLLPLFIPSLALSCCCLLSVNTPSSHRCYLLLVPCRCGLLSWQFINCLWVATLEHVVGWKANNPIKMTLNFWVMVAVFQQSMGQRWVFHAAIFFERSQQCFEWEINWRDNIQWPKWWHHVTSNAPNNLGDVAMRAMFG